MERVCEINRGKGVSTHKCCFWASSGAPSCYPGLLRKMETGHWRFEAFVGRGTKTLS